MELKGFVTETFTFAQRLAFIGVLKAAADASGSPSLVLVAYGLLFVLALPVISAIHPYCMKASYWADVVGGTLGRKIHVSIGVIFFMSIVAATFAIVIYGVVSVESALSNILQSAVAMKGAR